MAKLSLRLDDIRVDSFPTVRETEGEKEGTVRGFAKPTPFGTCGENTCANTCDGVSCAPSFCIASCWETCRITCGNCTAVD
ncbi:MAG TPA: hypothetical protein VFQ39_15135 [Longimicrobium sp.]|nr:hypothetical protein [Longimicrobium sp.]